MWRWWCDPSNHFVVASMVLAKWVVLFFNLTAKYPKNAPKNPQVSEVKSSYSIRVPYHQAFATTIHLLLLLSSSYPSCIKSSDSSKPWIPMPWIPWRRLLLSDFPWKRAAHHGDLDEAKKLLEKGTRLMAIAKGVGDSFIWPPKKDAKKWFVFSWRGNLLLTQKISRLLFIWPPKADTEKWSVFSWRRTPLLKQKMIMSKLLFIWPSQRGTKKLPHFCC